MDKENMMCNELARELSAEDGITFTAMAIGRIRNKVCSDADIDGKYIKPSGIVKICRYLEVELDKREEAEEQLARCKVLNQKNTNPRFIVAKDLETKKRCLIGVPANRKAMLDKPGKFIKATRILRNGKYFYNCDGKM